MNTSKTQPSIPFYSSQNIEEGSFSLIIPTVSTRVEYFSRCLKHLDNIRFDAPIYVSDHSTPDNRETVSSLAKQHKSLDIRIVHHDPEMHFLERLISCAELANSRYIMIHADDDAVFPDAIKENIDFLNNHDEYSASRGRMLFFQFGKKGNLMMSPHYGSMREEPDKQARMLTHLTNFFPTLYAVHRKDLFIEAYRETLRHTENVIFWQYLASCLTVHCGPVATLQGFHYARLNNEMGWRASLVKHRDLSHWPMLFLNPDFSNHLADFRNGLVKSTNLAESNMEMLDNGCLSLLGRAMGMSTPEKTAPGEALFQQQCNMPGTLEQTKLAYIHHLYKEN